MSINKIILELRKEKGLSQQQVANAVGISQSTIAKIEINRNEATASTIRKLADFFDVSADYLLERSDDFGSTIVPTAPALTDNERVLLDWFRGLPSEHARASFLSFIRSDSGFASKRN